MGRALLRLCSGTGSSTGTAPVGARAVGEAACREGSILGEPSIAAVPSTTEPSGFH